jgi:hypothetical protein
MILSSAFVAAPNRGGVSVVLVVVVVLLVVVLLVVDLVTVLVLVVTVIVVVLLVFVVVMVVDTVDVEGAVVVVVVGYSLRLQSEQWGHCAFTTFKANPQASGAPSKTLPADHAILLPQDEAWSANTHGA